MTPKTPDGYSLGSIIQGDRYSPEFETCWAYVCASDAGKCYLEGMEQTIQDLLSSEWEVVGCARCDMPVPMMLMGTNHSACPCSDLGLWPNFDVPQPRSPIDGQTHLLAIQSRLLAVSIAVRQANEPDLTQYPQAQEVEPMSCPHEPSSCPIALNAAKQEQHDYLRSVFLTPTLDYDEKR